MRCFGSVVALVGLTVSSFAPASLADAPAFKIGAIVSLSGTYGIIGQSMQRAVQVALDLRDHKELGAPIEITWEDDETKPQVAVQKGTRLLGNHVHMLFGSVASSSTLALERLADQRKVPIIVTASGDDRITGSEKSHYAFRTTHNISSEMLTVLAYVKKMRIKKLYGIAADYNVMRDGWVVMRDKAKADGVEIVGEDFPQLGNQDYSVIIDKVLHSGAEAVALLTTGSDAVTFVKQAAEVHLNDKIKVIGPNLMDESFAKAAGPASIGIQSALRYDFSYDTPANKAFVAAYRKKFNDWPDAFAGEAFDGITWWLDVVDSTKSWDPEVWVAAFEKSRFDKSVDGNKIMLACNHQAMQVGFWGQVERGGTDAPPYIMNITQVFKPEEIFPTCQ